MYKRSIGSLQSLPQTYPSFWQTIKLGWQGKGGRPRITTRRGKDRRALMKSPARLAVLAQLLEEVLAVLNEKFEKNGDRN